MDPNELTTCLIATSPIPSHPKTDIIHETIASIRFHLPQVPIGILSDGVRPEQEHLREAYEVYRCRLEMECLLRYTGVTVINAPVWRHQVAMLRTIMPFVARPFILWAEHDTPLTRDSIDFKGILKAIATDAVDLIRFLPEPEIHPAHQHLMCGEIDVHDVHLTKTIQFSARPHVASKMFYNKMLLRFSPDAKCFVEDFLHGVCQGEPWENWKMSIYSPVGNKKRSYHLCGREDGPKFDDKQVF